MASVAVVLEVGASPSGQASWETLTSICTSAFFASVEAGLPVRAISGTPSRLSNGSRVRISSVSPELDNASTTSRAVIMPMSPWLASAG